MGRRDSGMIIMWQSQGTVLEKEIREIWDKCHQESEILKYLVCSNVVKTYTWKKFQG